MRIALLAYGTRGDVQPLVALGLALRARGHDVVVGAPENHRRFIEATGLAADTIAGNSDELLQTDEARAVLARGDLVTFMRLLIKAFIDHQDAAELDVERITAGADGIVSGVLVGGLARVFADVRGIPFAIAHTFPGLPSRHVPMGVIDLPHALPGVVHAALGHLVARGIWWALGDIDKAMRGRRGLTARPYEPGYEALREGRPSLHLWSPALVPAPPDWPAADVVTGFCGLPTDARARLGEQASLGALEPFLQAGPPPLYLGLGSMPVLDAGAAVAMVVDVAARLGVRVLLGGAFAGDAGLAAQLPPAVRFCGPVDHDALFPRCAGVLHHGGAGTTAAGLRAGRPTMICPVLGDQPFWGRIVVARGAGAMTPFRKLNAARLERGLRTLLDPGVAARAAALGEAMRGERPGADVAANAVERWFAR